MFLRTLFIKCFFPGITVGLNEMLFISKEILTSHVPGCVVECGCFRGGSTSIISVACKKSGRRLHVFDSFCGLPEPVDGDSNHQVLSFSEIHHYQRGAFSASLEMVKANVSRFGAIDICTFWPGYFEKTLPSFREQVAIVFCDADLVESVKTCILHLWPLMPDGAAFFTHEAHHLEVAKFFHDDSWWQENLNQSAPGLIGSGSGLGLSFKRNHSGYHASALGFVRKNPQMIHVSEENLSS
jgi:O-methyltransferase